MRALIIEDDPTISQFIASGLQRNGYEVDVASDGTEGAKRAQSSPYNFAIVDIILPKKDGLTVVKELRTAGKTLPIIILSAKRSVEERVEGLKLGADDYLVKPFSFAELLARIQAVLRRSSGAPEPTQLSYRDLTLDLISREVKRGGALVNLQQKEFSMLEILMKNSGRVISKNLIMERVWNYHFDPQTNIVDVLVCRLRSKIDLPGQTKLIHTVRGSGYVLR